MGGISLSAAAWLFRSFRNMTRFNGCIDLHHGQVKQIVGGSLSDKAPEDLKTNFVSR